MTRACHRVYAHCGDPSPTFCMLVERPWCRNPMALPPWKDATTIEEINAACKAAVARALWIEAHRGVCPAAPRRPGRALNRPTPPDVGGRMQTPSLPKKGNTTHKLSDGSFVTLTYPQRLAFAAVAAAERQRNTPSPAGRDTQVRIVRVTGIEWRDLGGIDRWATLNVNVLAYASLRDAKLVTRVGGHLTPRGRELAALIPEDVDVFGIKPYVRPKEN